MRKQGKLNARSVVVVNAGVDLCSMGAWAWCAGLVGIRQSLGSGPPLLLFIFQAQSVAHVSVSENLFVVTLWLLRVFINVTGVHASLAVTEWTKFVFWRGSEEDDTIKQSRACPSETGSRFSIICVVSHWYKHCSRSEYSLTETFRPYAGRELINYPHSS